MAFRKISRISKENSCHGKACNFTRKVFHGRCFPMNLVQLSGKLFLRNTSKTLFLFFTVNSEFAYYVSGLLVVKDRRQIKRI